MPSRHCGLFGWLGSCLALAVACAGAGAPSPKPKPVASHSAAPPPAPTQSAAVQCPDDQEHQPGLGCVYVADGSPPTAVGLAMRPIPDGRVGEPPDGRMVRSFWLDERSVTAADYRACLDAGSCSAPEKGEHCAWGQQGKESEPLSCATWEQASAYCGWAKKRLPTDLEWDRLAEKPDVYGIAGVGGELAEWTADHFCSEEIGGCGHSRVIRGHRKPADRGRFLPSLSPTWVGFRCAWSTSEPRRAASPPPLLPLVTATPGRVLCNTTSCDLSAAVCCHNTQDGLGRCIPKEQRTCRSPELWSQCDENADCDGNKVCCPSWGCSGGCPEDRMCQDRPCDQGDEICLPGGQCRAGFECEAEAGHRRGRCRWQDVGAWCGTKRCSGDKPVCCLPAGKTSGYCSANDCKTGQYRLACSRPGDCGGSACGVSQSFAADPNAPNPGYTCTTLSHMVQAVACDTIRDCPRHPPTGTVAKACRQTAEVPRGVKECIYFDGAP